MLAKTVVWRFVASAALLCSAVCGTLAAIYSPEYVYRCLVRGLLGASEDPADVRVIQASTAPFHFRHGLKEDEERTIDVLEDILKTDDLDDFLDSTGTQAFIVIQGDRLLYERYADGHGPNSLLPSHSVTKSFLSALIGVAIAEGNIRSIEDPITKYLPELAERDPGFSRIRIRNLLTMSSGIRFDDYFFFTSDSALSGTYPDLRHAVLTFPRIVEPPGKRFWYNDYNPQLLGLILERATHKSISEYLEEHIWKSIGMEYDGSWILDSRHSGFEKAQGGLNARAIDFAKFGRLYLMQGDWNGRKVLPAQWVAESTQGTARAGDSDYYPTRDRGVPKGLYYQYMWWGIRDEAGGMNDFYAMGRGGQMIYVSTSRNLIVLRFGEGRSDESIWYLSAHQFAVRLAVVP